MVRPPRGEGSVPARPKPDRAAPGRLTPDMASYRGHVLAFIRQYWDEWGQSPSYGEIVGALGGNRNRVKAAVLSLVRDRLILRTPGPRGLRLPDQCEAAIRLLEELGFDIDPDARAVTNPTLLRKPELTYPSSSGRRRGAMKGNGAR